MVVTRPLYKNADKKKTGARGKRKAYPITLFHKGNNSHFNCFSISAGITIEPDIIGAVTHTTVNVFSHGKFSRGTSHLGFSFPWFQRLHANCDFPR